MDILGLCLLIPTTKSVYLKFEFGIISPSKLIGTHCKHVFQKNRNQLIFIAAASF